jgi:hypothetical protein
LRSGGQRAAAAVLLAAGLALLPSCKGQPAGIYPLDDATVESYLRIYPRMVPILKEAREAREKPAATAEKPEVQQLLATAGWSWSDYLRIDGSIANAMLRIESPELFRRMEMRPEDAPPGNVDVVERHYYELKKMKLIVEDATKPGPGGGP